MENKMQRRVPSFMIPRGIMTSLLRIDRFKLFVNREVFRHE